MKKIVTFLLILLLLFSGCGQKEEKEWTYELLEEELGGIIETDFNSVRDCLALLKKQNYYVCGYVTYKYEDDSMDYDLSDVHLSDDMENGIYTIMVASNSDTVHILETGQFVYARGTYLYSSGDGSSLYAKNGYISIDQKAKEYISVMEYVSLMEKIYNDTYFKTEGVIIQDGTHTNGTPEYKLYESAEAYKESNSKYISIEFSEEQHNINGKTVVLIGKPDTSAAFGLGLLECSIIEEK